MEKIFKRQKSTKQKTNKLIKKTSFDSLSCPFLTTTIAKGKLSPLPRLKITSKIAIFRQENDLKSGWQQAKMAVYLIWQLDKQIANLPQEYLL